MATDDVKMALSKLAVKTNLYNQLERYYDGEQELQYAVLKLREVFGDTAYKYVANFCELVANSVLDKIRLHHWIVPDDKTSTEVLKRLWTSSGLEEDEDAIFRAVVIYGEAYIIGERVEDLIEAYYHDPRSCHLFYLPNRPRVARMGVKYYFDDVEFWYLNLYYTDRTEVWRAEGQESPGPDAFSLIESVPSATGRIPLFRVVLDPHKIKGIYQSVMTLQDAVNNLLSNMMITGEFGSFPQRWTITNQDISKLKNGPSQIWRLAPSPEGDQPVQVGEFQQVDLTRFLDGMDRIVNWIMAITKIPKHYFLSGSSELSGEALIAMEAPLNQRVMHYERRIGNTLSWVAAHLLFLEMGEDFDPNSLKPIWDSPVTRQPKTEAEIRQISVATGLPLITVLRREGWTEEEIAQMQDDQDEEAAAKQVDLANSMLQAQQQFDAGQEEVDAGTGSSSKDARVSG